MPGLMPASSHTPQASSLAPDFLVVEDDDDDFFLVADLLRTDLEMQGSPSGGRDVELPAAIPDAESSPSCPRPQALRPNVVQAHSVDEALDCLDARQFALILLDYSLGAKTGLDLLAELRARDNVTPVIFLTGHGDEQLAVRALKGGAVDYLPKSKMNRESLAAAVRHALALRDRDTAVREAREALFAREREYRTLFEKANDAIFILDPDTEIILEANPAAARLYGVEHDQLIGKSLIEFSTDIVRGRRAIDECLASGELANFEALHVSRNGHRLHLLLSASLIDYRGRPSLLNICRDISERKAAEQEIFRLNRALKALSKCNEALLRASAPQEFLEEICNIMVQVGGYRMAWVAAAPSAADDRIRPLAIAGTEREYVEIVCDRYCEFPDSPLLVPTAIRTGAPAVCRDTSSGPPETRKECLEHGFASIIVLPLLREGRIFGALAVYAGERDAFDNAEVDLLRELAGNVSYGLDSIEAREQREFAQAELKSSEARYRTLFERNLAGVFRATAEGTLLEANQAFLRMLGYESAEQMRNVQLPQLCAAAGCLERWHEKLLRTGQLVNQELCILRRDGGTAYLLANLVSLRAKDSPELIEGTVLDVTEHRQLQAQLLHSQKMDAIGQLAGGIAHDFNNLLMVVRSYAEMAREAIAEQRGAKPDAPGSGPETSSRKPEASSLEGVTHQLDAIVKAADRGAALTRQLLTFGRKQAFSPRIVELNSVLENMTRVLPRALGEDVRVELRAAPGLWQVKADPVQLEQLVLNLAVNARDAMPSGGRLTIETSNTTLDSDYIKMHAGVMPGEYVLLAVSDTGHGIAPDVLPRIFEPFFTTKERGKGTGLGLPTVYGIVQQCGGFVWVYSEVGQGTVFKIYLPRAGTGIGTRDSGVGISDLAVGTPDSGLRVPNPESLNHGCQTVLIVEDEDAVRCATRDYLGRRGYRVLEAACGEDALRLSDQHAGAIDLLVTDAVMPGMSGMALAQEMSARRPGIRILCVSGYTEASMSAHGLSADTAFLQKPFSLAALAAKVRELLDVGSVVRRAS